MTDLVSISLGAGVQSSALYLMACQGEVTPQPDVAIFADTQREPTWVYEQIEYLRRAGSIPIDVVTAGDLGEAALASKNGSRWAAIPFWVEGQDGKESKLRRNCTRDYKLDPIKKRTREILGLKPRQRAAGRVMVEQWVGISTDEVHRMKPANESWIAVRWPLIEAGMSRADCLSWLKRRGHPTPERSACTFCPYHDNRYWAWMKERHPETFAEAVDFDRALRLGAPLRGVTGIPYVHRSLQPLDSVDFGHDSSNQLEIGFGNECEGICGV